MGCEVRTGVAGIGATQQGCHKGHDRDSHYEKRDGKRHKRDDNRREHHRD